MFTDENVGVVEFPSSWKKERPISHSATQTREIFTEEKAAQSRNQSHRSCQTDVDDEMGQMRIENDSPALLKFLLQVEPLIAMALEKNMRSTAFEGYDVGKVQDIALATGLYTLGCDVYVDQLSVTGLTWNSTGSVVAACYGKFDHEDWCTHKAGLCTWNLNRRNIDSQKPDMMLDVASCLMAVAFHPKNPALIAGGTFNGEVCVWDLSKDTDLLVASSGMGDVSHRDPVSKVLWLTDKTKAKGNRLMSVSLDGKMLMWSINEDNHSLELTGGFVLLAKSMPKSSKVKSAYKNQEMGVTCISVNPEDSSIFYAGSESGGVFKCSMDANHDNVSVSHGSGTLKSPVSFAFLPHHGPAYSVDCSPFHRNLFITCSSDTSVRLYTALQSQPILTIEPNRGYVFSARWSQVRPLVFAVTTEDGHLLVYDLKVSRTMPVLTLEASGIKRPVYAMEFNRNQRQLLATGDGQGYIKIWQLSDELTSEVASEREALNAMDALALE